MIHFLCHSKVNLDVFTSRKDVIEFAPIQHGVNVLPKWWKNLPKERFATGRFFPLPTMKTCSGVIDYYRNSVAMPLWSDLAVCIDENRGYRWQFSDKSTPCAVHDLEEYEGFIADNKYGHMKLTSPWVFQTKSDINWMMTQPIYNEENFLNYTTATGIVNFSKQGSTNIQLFVDATYPKTFTIAFGTPFMFTPMSSKKVVIHRHLISESEFITKYNKFSMMSKFVNSYRMKTKTIVCPYHNKVEK